MPAAVWWCKAGAHLAITTGRKVTMPIGSFLDSFPALLFVAAHVMFLIVGVWAWKRTGASGRRLAPLFWLYIAAQAIFLGFFAGAVTMKMAVLIDQTLMVVMVAAIASRASTPA
ncbi:MAG TPA: hypothetical protein VN903_35855 [Polyangia bacterium]|nr:hypothetical protein [Polyangia bacterium]